MLDFLRRKTQSYGTYLVLGLIIVTFVISFGPASNKITCGATNVLAYFADSNITVLDWRYAMNMAEYTGRMRKDKGVQYRRYAMDLLLKRNILIKLAHKQGIRFSRKDAEDLILKNKTIIFGKEYKLSDVGAWPINPKTKKPGEFNYDLFKEWVRYRAGFTDVNDYLDQLVMEMEAKAYIDAFVLGSAYSTNASWVEYQVQNLKMWLKEAEFRGEQFKDSIQVSESEAQKLLSEPNSKKKCEDEYEANKAKYETGPKQRIIKAAIFKMSPAGIDVFKEAGMQRPKGKFAGVSPQDFMVMDKIQQAKTLDATNFPNKFKELGAEIQDFTITKDATLGDEVFKSEMKKLTGPVAGPDGIYFFIVNEEKQITYDKDKALFLACKSIIKKQKSESKALLEAENALKQLQQGKKPEDIFGKGNIPTIMDVGPISPLEEQPPLFTKSLLKELWSLKEGNVLPKVETRDNGKTKTYYILILSKKEIPSKQDFMDKNKLEEMGSLTQARAYYAINEVLYKRCKSLVRQGDLDIEAPLYKYLYYKKRGDLDPKEAAKMPPEKYSPCMTLSPVR